MLSLLLSVVSSPQSPEIIELSRGADLKGQIVRYFGVEDTTLDPSTPESSQGGIAFLKGGASKVILIRFGDLPRSIGANKKIKSASLILTPTSPSQTKLDRAADVLVEWHEGPAFVVNFGNLNADAGKAAEGAATYRWRSAGSSPEPWKGNGASGLGETSTISKARLAVLEDGKFSVSGIESAIQRTYDSPFQIGGVALQFSSACEFYSSQSPQFSPVLRLELEDNPDVTGFDLSVSTITRSPWPSAPKSSTEPAWPKDGEMIEHRAEIRNVGSLPCDGYRFRWKRDGSWGGWVQDSSSIAPGVVKEAAISIPFQQPRTNMPLPSITFEVEALQPEANRANNALEVPIAGLGIAIQIPTGWKPDMNSRGSNDPMDAAQALIDFFNKIAFTQSRYSFAPGGANERLFVSGFNTDVSKSADFTMELQQNSNSNFQSLTKQISPISSLSNTPLIPGPFMNPFAGISRAGETRFDGVLPRTFFMPNLPVYHPLLNIALAEPTGLMSMTEVFGLNQDLGKRGSERSKYIQNCPVLTVFKALYMTDQVLAGTKMSVYSFKANGEPEDKPIAVLTTDSNGGFQLPKHLVDGKSTTHPFGPLLPNGLNTALLLIPESGSPSLSVIYAWQILDLYARAGTNPAVIEVRFNASDAPIEPTNLATNRIVTSSENQTVSGVHPLLDGDRSTYFQLPGNLGAWVEIDLGRDRPIGEISLVFEHPWFWQDFEIVGYNTGQRPEEAQTWRKVRDSASTAFVIGEDYSASGIITVPFRAPAQRFRFIRIRNLKAGKSTKLYELQVNGVVQSKQ